MQKKSTSKQTYAYTPGLKVKKMLKIIKERKLPIPGDVLVNINDFINYNTIIARTFSEGDAHIINGANLLRVDSEDVVDYLVKNKGDHINEGEVLLFYSAFFGLIKRDVKSPIDGYIDAISETTGQIILRENPQEINVDAYIPGKVVDIISNEGVLIETNAAIIQGIFGVGGEAHGILKIKSTVREDTLTTNMISEEDKGHILIGGSAVTLAAINRAIEVEVAGIIVGGVEPVVLTELMQEEVGVAITGQEEIGLTLIITEGFGKMPISERTFILLRDFDGKMAHINGATQIRAGVMRPEIIIPHENLIKDAVSDELSAGIVPGTPLRLIREPYFGAIGKVVSLPIELQLIETESYVRVVEVELENGRNVVVPRANVEIIEE